MKRTIRIGFRAACFGLGLGFAAPLLAAEPAAPGAVTSTSAGEKTVSATKPAENCLSDLRAFDSQMGKDGYWLGGSGFGYGYPMRGYGFGYPMGGYPAKAEAGYQNARPGYEVRVLIASANILARRGQQQACEDVLATTRDVYKAYAADMRSGPVTTSQ